MILLLLDSRLRPPWMVEMLGTQERFPVRGNDEMASMVLLMESCVNRVPLAPFVKSLPAKQHPITRVCFDMPCAYYSAPVFTPPRAASNFAN